MLRAACLLVLAGCLGEGGVTYQGVVVEDATSSYAFQTSLETGGQTPVEGALVELRIDSDVVDDTRTDAAGYYHELSAVFGGFIGVDTHVEVRISAPDGRAMSYATVYEDTDDTTDPTTANPSCETPCPPNFLVFALGAAP